MVEGNSGLGMSLGQRGALGWPGVVDAPNWTLRVVDFSRKALGSLDTCHHFDEGQILITTDASLLPHLSESTIGKSGKRICLDGL